MGKSTVEFISKGLIPLGPQEDHEDDQQAWVGEVPDLPAARAERLLERGVLLTIFIRGVECSNVLNSTSI